MNYVFIINPVAGKGGQQDEIAGKIRKFFENRKEDSIHIYLSQYAGDAIRFGKEYPLPEDEETCFVACGGDGTFYEVVNGAFGRPNVSFTIYPCGSGNDFIKSVGGKPSDYLNLQNLVDGQIKVYDAIRVGDRICSNLCNIGIDSVICAKMYECKKIPGISGPTAYNLSTALTIASHAVSGIGFPMKVTFDSGEVLENRYMLSVFGNGKVYGGGYYPVPDASMDDGLIDFCCVSEASIFKIGKLIGTYKAGKHVGNPAFDGLLEMRRCTSAIIESPEDLTVCIDGEIFKSKRVEVEMLPASLPFRIPKFE